MVAVVDISQRPEPRLAGCILNSLFDNAETCLIPKIPGLTYLPNFITTAEADTLVTHIDDRPWRSDLKRRVQHYGYRYDYKARVVGRDAYGPLPDWLSPLCLKLVSESLLATIPDQVIVNEYLPGQGISEHVDCVPCFGDTIASLSLGSPCVMNFTHPRTPDPDRVHLSKRSLIVLSDAARYEWRHSIPARKSDIINGVRFPRGRRLSITFRIVLLNPR
jgi:alkylated DNA repair dioxygenase AlkB